MSIIVAALIALGVVVSIELFFILALGRQIGVILSRMGGSGSSALAGASGPALGSYIAPFTTDTLAGKSVSALNGSRDLLIVFGTSTCDICKGLYPALQTLSRGERGSTDVIFLLPDARNGDGDAVEPSLLELAASVDVVASEELFGAFDVWNTPYGVFIARDGTVLGRGLVNTLEHLESLIAMRDNRDMIDRLVTQGARPGNGEEVRS